MDKLNARSFEIARNINAKVLNIISKVGQNNIAPAIDTSEATMSRLVPQLENAILVLKACGYNVVDERKKCFDPEVIDPYLKIAKQKVAELESFVQLEHHGEPEDLV